MIVDCHTYSQPRLPIFLAVAAFCNDPAVRCSASWLVTARLLAYPAIEEATLLAAADGLASIGAHHPRASMLPYWPESARPVPAPHGACGRPGARPGL